MRAWREACRRPPPPPAGREGRRPSSRPEVQEDLAVAVGPRDLRLHFGLDRVALRGAPLAESCNGQGDQCGIAHDATLPHLGAPHLELRLEQRDDLRVRRRAVHRKQDLRQADEGHVGHDQAHRFGKRLECAGVDPLDDDDTRILAQAPVQEPATNVEGVYPGRSAAEEDVGEPSRGGSDVGADAAKRIDPEAVEGRRELQGAAACVSGLRVDVDGRVFSHRAVGAALRLAGDADLAGEDQGLRARSRFDEAALRHQHVKSQPQRTGRKIPTASPITAPIRTSNGVWPSSSRSRASWTPRMWTRSSTRRFSTSASRPAARRSPAASYITTNVKIRAIAKAAEARPEYLPTAAVRPMTMALWLPGIPPVSASPRRLSRRCRTDVNVTLAACAMTQATSGGRRYLTRTAILRFRLREPSTWPGAIEPRPAA